MLALLLFVGFIHNLHPSTEAHIHSLNIIPIRNTQDQWPKVGDDTELAFLRSTEAQARTIPHSKGSRPTGILTTWNQGPVTR